MSWNSTYQADWFAEWFPAPVNAIDCTCFVTFAPLAVAATAQNESGGTIPGGVWFSGHRQIHAARVYINCTADISFAPLQVAGKSSLEISAAGSLSGQPLDVSAQTSLAIGANGTLAIPTASAAVTLDIITEEELFAVYELLAA